MLYGRQDEDLNAGLVCNSINEERQLSCVLRNTKQTQTKYKSQKLDTTNLHLGQGVTRDPRHKMKHSHVG